MEKALLTVSDDFCNSRDKKSNIVIFTDALSVLQALENSTSKDNKINNLSAVIGQLINTHTVDITLQWIPGHVQIPGNDRADALAKQGAMKTQDICKYRYCKTNHQANQEKDLDERVVRI